MKLIPSDLQQRSYCGSNLRRFVWKMPAMGMKALELHLGAIEEGLPTDIVATGSTVGGNQSDTLGNILLVNPGFRHSLRCKFDTCRV